jgi:hypothetical protein
VAALTRSTAPEGWLVHDLWAILQRLLARPVLLMLRAR